MVCYTYFVIPRQKRKMEENLFLVDTSGDAHMQYNLWMWKVDDKAMCRTQTVALHSRVTFQILFVRLRTLYFSQLIFNIAIAYSFATATLSTLTALSIIIVCNTATM